MGFLLSGPVAGATRNLAEEAGERIAGQAKPERKRQIRRSARPAQ
jgi:hypothetical protein